jgi:hypothetical protein
MQVDIAPNAPYGVYTWTVTATDSNMLQESTTYQLTIISPTVTTIGFTTSAYAITYGSQQALFYVSCGGSCGHWFVVYSDGTNLIYRASTDSSGDAWSSSNIIINGIDQGYSFSVANNGNTVYLALLTPSYTTGFYFTQGTIVGSLINWAVCSGSCGLGPIQMSQLSVPVGLTTAGTPNLFVDTSAMCPGGGPCVWATVPALDSNLMWHVEVGELTTSWHLPASIGAIGDIALHQVYTGPDSQVHSEMYIMPDAVAATFAVGNTPELPHLSVFLHNYGFVGTFCVGGELSAGVCPAPPLSWSGIKVYMQQQQGAVLPASLGTDVIFFAGLATNGAPGADVQFYDFNYNAAVPGSSTFSAPTAPPGISTIPANAVVNHSWHISMVFGGASLYLAYGVDDNLAFQVGTVGSAPSYTVTWSVAIQVPGVSNLVNGVTITYSGSTVGLTWVQTQGAAYAVKFCVI